ncbi:Hypothetical predicted protein [Mytilus galloprovincialis]|uniref:Uncharacterized protein n=1 Tax=Mytilus galloprovincialis TaxID=29158 RepID=A0A8B6BYN8_MYTGA|nr:Hypothetical predicted protein [Mytilus galloprovincialis]
MEKLKAIRGGYRNVVTRLINRTNDKILENDFKMQELSPVVETLVKKRNQLENLDADIIQGTEVENMEQEIMDNEEFNLKIEVAIHKYKDIISNSVSSFLKPTDVVTCRKSSISIQKDDIVDSDFEGNE